MTGTLMTNKTFREELRVDKQEMIDVKERLDYLVKFVNKQKQKT